MGLFVVAWTKPMMTLDRNPGIHPLKIGYRIFHPIYPVYQGIISIYIASNS
jgi:hypothetical protein